MKKKNKTQQTHNKKPQNQPVLLMGEKKIPVNALIWTWKDSYNCEGAELYLCLHS